MGEMARIRSVHPDMCVSEVMSGLSAELERTFVRLWTHCDDEGRCLDNPRLVKAALYPLHDEVTAEQMDAELNQLQAAGLIVRYARDGHDVIAVPSWDEYQHPRHPAASKLPAYDPASSILRTQICKTDSPICNSSTIRRRLTDIRATGVGEGEGVGDGVGEGAVDKNTSTARVFLAWVEATDRDPQRTKLTPARCKRVDRALKDYPEDDLLDAVRGVTRSPFHMGQNDRSKRFDDIELILRDAQHIEEFRDLWRNLRAVPVYDSVLAAIADDRRMRGEL